MMPDAPAPHKRETPGTRLAYYGSMRNPRIPRLWLIPGLATALLAGCEALEELPARLFDDRPPRQRYEESLLAAGLGLTALVRDWMSAGSQALTEAAPVTPPYAEEGFLQAGEPVALGFRVTVQRGQEVAFELRLNGDTTSSVFLDAWYVGEDSAGTLRSVATADSGARELTFTPRRTGDYVLRAQPELLRGGRFSVTLHVRPSLAFPVEDGREGDIGSVFGDPRDGGRRDHHGVDIFVPRGTPALAANEAVVARVQTTNRGGNVVWLRDVDGNSLYYAHLDRQAVETGMRVFPGDTVGYVGNTGNARTTPPHLHFGVYRRGEGPLNPWYFVYQPRGSIRRLTADTTVLGAWARTPGRDTELLRAPYQRSEPVASLSAHTALRVVAAVGDWYRVRLPDGTHGYLPARSTERTERAVLTTDVYARTPVLARPGAASPSDVVTEVGSGDSVAVLGRFRGYMLVQTAAGTSGWVVEPAPATTPAVRGGS